MAGLRKHACPGYPSVLLGRRKEEGWNGTEQCGRWDGGWVRLGWMEVSRDTDTLMMYRLYRLDRVIGPH